MEMIVRCCLFGKVAVLERRVAGQRYTAAHLVLPSTVKREQTARGKWYLDIIEILSGERDRWFCTYYKGILVLTR